MKYLCLMYYAAKGFDTMPKAEMERFQTDIKAYDEMLIKGGHMIRAEALESTEMATTLRVRNAKLSATDGPFAETKEQLCGFILIDAPDLDGAIKLAQDSPFAKIGSVEVRPVMSF